MLLHKTKRALIGVGVLIIFLSTILAASITAGVLIRTSGVLQQKATEVERTIRERLITGFDVVSASAQGNTTTNKINNFEFFVRLRAGSSAIQLGETFFTFASEDVTTTADLQDPYTYYKTTQILFLNSSNSSSIADLDGDGIADRVSLEANSNSTNTTDLEALVINLSSAGAAYVSLEADFSNASVNQTVELNIPDGVIQVNGTVYGYTHVKGETDTAMTIQDPVKFYISTLSFTCRFETLTAETKYCAYAFVGDEDTVIDAGELIGLRFKVREAKALTVGEEVEIQLVPKEGDIMRLTVKMPNLVKSAIRIL